METALMTIFLIAWLLCSCTIETICDEPGGVVIFFVAFVLCIAIAIIFDRSDM